MVRLETNNLKGVNKKYGDVFDADIPRLKEFTSKYSERNRTGIRNRLIYFNEWIRAKHGIENILKVEYDQINDFLENEIDKRQITLVTKEKWRIQIKKYYDYIKDLRNVMTDTVFMEHFKMKKADFINPVPKKFNFTKQEINLSDIKSKYLEQNLTYNHALKLLNYYFYENFEMFIMVSFMCFSGPRIQEIVSIKDKNIELSTFEFINDDGKKESIFLRFFLTKLKRTHKVDKSGVYFFPEFLVEFLKLYIEQKELKYPGEEYLFPSSRIKGQHITQTQVRKRIHQTCNLLKIEVYISPHRFRALLNTWRVRRGVDPIHRSKLLNHTIDRLESKHYNLDYKEFIKVQKLYDETFPFPDFKPNPNYL